MRRAWLVLWLVGVVSTGVAQEAATVPIGVAFAPGTGDPVGMVARDVGFVVTTDAGSWRILCTRALGVSANGPLQLVGRDDGQLVLGSLRGLQHLDLETCEWPYPDAELENPTVIQLESHADALYALTNDSNVYSVYRSEDGGDSFEVALELPVDVAFLSFVVAPSDSNRIYLNGVTTDLDAGTTTRWLFRTTDGGNTFQTRELEFGESGSPKVLAVDPEDLELIYLALATGASSHSHGEEEETTDQVFVSRNGGTDFELLHEVRLLGGFALGPEAGEIWIGDAEGGLHRSANGGDSFDALHEGLHVSCLAQRDDRLWICADSTRDPFSLGYTDDAGETLTAVMRFDEVAGPLQCDGGLRECDPAWRSWMFWHNPSTAMPASSSGGTDAGVSPPPDSPGTMDAGAQPRDNAASASGGGGGCGCRVVTAADVGGFVPPAVALFALRRRRRRPYARR